MAQGGQSQGGGLADLSSVFKGDTKRLEIGANYIEDIHAVGFTIGGQVEGTDFLGIEGSTYVNPGELWQGVDPEEQMINVITDTHSTGFVSHLQEGDDTLFSGVVGTQFNNPGDLGFGGVLDMSPIDVIDNTFATGFTSLGLIEEGNIFTTQFIGIEGEEYTNPGTLGTILIGYQQDLNAPQTQWATEGSIFQTSEEFVDTIPNIHANGFTWLGPIELGNIFTTQFIGIEGLLYSNPGELWEGIDPENQSVHASELHFSPGFVTGLTEEDDTLFLGIAGSEFENPGEMWNSEHGNLGGGVNWIPNYDANGFTYLGPIEEGNVYTTQFVGITVEGQSFQFINTGQMGFGGVNDEGYANYIEDNVMTGFTPNRAPGTGEIYNSVSEFINAVGLEYSNPGIGLGIHYYESYADDGTGVDYIENRFMTGFTKNRAPGTGELFNSISEFIGIGGVPEDLLYDNPNLLTQIMLNAQQIGLDIIKTSGVNGEGGPHADGFTSYIQDKIDGGVDSEYHLVNPITNGAGTIYDEVVPGSGEDVEHLDEYDYYLNGGINDTAQPADVLIQQGGNRSLIIDGTQVTELTLGDIYKNHIDKLIDWEKVEPINPVGSSYVPNIGNGGFLPFAFSRTSKISSHPGLYKLSEGAEPYIVRPIPATSDNNEGRSDIVTAHLEDAVRLAKYAISADGVKFMGIQMASGLGAYMVHRGITHGSAVGGSDDQNTDRKYNEFAAGLVGGHQQFRYLYNPLSMFSSNIPFVKVRLDRAWGIGGGKYTERKQVLWMNITKNAKINKDIFTVLDPSFSGNPPFDNQPKDPKEDPITTLGGDLSVNVNKSIDGTPVNVEGIVGDEMTLTPIDTMDIPSVKEPQGTSIHSNKHGFPFYFKDMRNERILAFRGYIEDINENVNANWSETIFIGRSEPVYTYQNASRDLNFTVKIFAMNPKELDMIYAKLDYLTNLCYPQYFKDDGLGYTRPKPPLTRLRLGDLYGGQPGTEESDYKNGVLGFIQSLNYSFDAPWETLLGDGHLVPKYITANISYKIISDKVPGMREDGTTRPLVSHYGYKYYHEPPARSTS